MTNVNFYKWRNLLSLTTIVVVVALNFFFSCTQIKSMNKSTLSSPNYCYNCLNPKLFIFFYSSMWKTGKLLKEKRKMGLLKLLLIYAYIAVLVMPSVLKSAESTVLIHFDELPQARSRFSTAVFRYSVEGPDRTNACKNNGCSIYCEVFSSIFQHLISG